MRGRLIPIPCSSKATAAREKVFGGQRSFLRNTGASLLHIPYLLQHKLFELDFGRFVFKIGNPCLNVLRQFEPCFGQGSQRLALFMH